MPQVSVIPANTSPAPTNADSPMKSRMDEPARARPQQHERTGCDANLPLQRDRLLATDDRQAGFHTGHRAAFDVDDVREARLEELLARLLTSASRTTNDVQRLVGRPLRACINAAGSS